MHLYFPTQTQNLRPQISSSKSLSEMLLASGTLKILKRESSSLFEYQKGENQFGPLQAVTFYQPTTVDKEPYFFLVKRLRLTPMPTNNKSRRIVTMLKLPPTKR